MRVLKIGGNELDDPGFLPLLAQWIGETAVHLHEQFVIVHGGGHDIAMMQTRLGLSLKR